MKANTIAEFKEVLIDASRLFNRKPYQVIYEQWQYLNKGRVSTSTVRLFGFAALRTAVAPSPNTSTSEKASAKRIIERLVAAGA